MPAPDLLPWHAVRRDRQYCPATLSGDADDVALVLQRMLDARGLPHRIDVMTDQIDVYVRGRKVAVYMP